MLKEHITRGEATVREVFDSLYKQKVFAVDTDVKDEFITIWGAGVFYDEAKADADFVIDAFNGFNRTGKTYSELEAENEELKKAKQTLSDGINEILNKTGL